MSGFNSVFAQNAFVAPAQRDAKSRYRGAEQARSDSLAPARGIALGLLLSLICWALIAVGVMQLMG